MQRQSVVFSCSSFWCSSLWLCYRCRSTCNVIPCIACILIHTHTRKTHQSICDVQLRDATFGIYCDTNGVQQTDVILTFISISCNFLLLLLLLFAVLSSFDDVAFKMFSRRQSLQPPDRQHWIGCCRCYCCCIRSFILVSFMNKTIPFL